MCGFLKSACEGRSRLLSCKNPEPLKAQHGTHDRRCQDEGPMLSPDDVWEPLGREAGPLQRVRHHQVIEERRVFLPNFIFLVDNAIFYYFIIHWKEEQSRH